MVRRAHAMTGAASALATKRGSIFAALAAKPVPSEHAHNADVPSLRQPAGAVSTVDAGLKDIRAGARIFLVSLRHHINWTGTNTR